MQRKNIGDFESNGTHEIQLACLWQLTFRALQLFVQNIQNDNVLAKLKRWKCTKCTFVCAKSSCSFIEIQTKNCHSKIPCQKVFIKNAFGIFGLMDSGKYFKTFFSFLCFVWFWQVWQWRFNGNAWIQYVSFVCYCECLMLYTIWRITLTKPGQINRFIVLAKSLEI